MSAQVESSFSLFDTSSHVLDQADLIELVSGATLRNSPPSRMVTSSPILTTTSQCLTRPSSPSLESAFNILGDQVIGNSTFCKVKSVQEACTKCFWVQFYFANPMKKQNKNIKDLY